MFTWKVYEPRRRELQFILMPLLCVTAYVQISNWAVLRSFDSWNSSLMSFHLRVVSQRTKIYWTGLSSLRTRSDSSDE